MSASQAQLHAARNDACTLVDCALHDRDDLIAPAGTRMAAVGARHEASSDVIELACERIECELGARRAANMLGELAGPQLDIAIIEIGVGDQALDLAQHAPLKVRTSARHDELVTARGGPRQVPGAAAHGLRGGRARTFTARVRTP